MFLFGGGELPFDAVTKFVKASQGKPIWILPWGTRFPDETVTELREVFTRAGATVVHAECNHLLSPDSRADLAQSILNAGAIFFPGGDQNVLFQRIRMNELVPALHQAYQSGVVMAGTSAGTAIQSNPMMSGRDSDATEGLGLLPNTIIDQHYIVRNREQRLLDALSQFPNYTGVGIDENMAAVVIDSQTLTALGPSEVWIYPVGLQKIILRNNEQTKLKTRSVR